jgi:hypothetical protein
MTKLLKLIFFMFGIDTLTQGFVGLPDARIHARLLEVEWLYFQILLRILAIFLPCQLRVVSVSLQAHIDREPLFPSLRNHNTPCFLYDININYTFNDICYIIRIYTRFYTMEIRYSIIQSLTYSHGWNIPDRTES